MVQESRIKYTIKNAWIGATSQIASFLLAFVVRTVFVYTLGNEYLSINGLFTNILTVLSFAELGIGASIVFSLYEPIAKNDYQKIGKLLNLFRKAYNYVALTIAIIGLSIIPFLKYIITDINNIGNIGELYLLFLLNTVASYIWGYKKSFLIACQKNYVVLLIHLGILIFQSVLQIGVLYLTHNFILFLCVMILSTVANNITTTLYVNRHYAHLREYETFILEKEERIGIFDNIKSIILYKIGGVILNGTNNIVISAFLKTTLVGLTSNYLLIINSVGSLINQSVSGIAASIGNYNVSATSDDNYRIFRQLNLISFWLFGFICMGLQFCLNPFIEIWLGQDYILSDSVVLSIVVGFYVMIVNSIPSSYRTAMGLFRQTKWYPLCAALANLTLSILFAHYWGIAGVFWATALSRMLFYNIVDSYYALKYGMKISPVEFYKTTIVQLIFVCTIYLICFAITVTVKLNGFHRLLFSIVLVTILYNSAFWFCFRRNPVFKQALSRLMRRA